MPRPTPILLSTLGVLAGFLGASWMFGALFSEFDFDASDADGLGGPGVLSTSREPHPSLQMFPRRGVPALGTAFHSEPGTASAADEPEAHEDAIAVDWERSRASLPLRYLDALEVDGFTAKHESPWVPDAEAFVISPELNAILQLDEDEQDAVRNVLLEARRRHAAPRWAAPASLTADGDGVVIEIAPAPADVESTLRASLSAIMGQERAAFFLRKIQPTLDWEYGGFGSARRRVEVSVLPDDTLSIRESLRRPSTATAPTGTPAISSPTPESFELQSRQYRVDHLPSHIAALVEVE